MMTDGELRGSWEIPALASPTDENENGNAAR